MAQRSYFFDSVAGDRIYTSADFARVFGALAGRDGVIYGYGDELKVTPGSGMAVKVGTGAAFVQGRMLEVYGQAETLPIATADATNPRIDRVVVRVDLSTAQRKAYLAVKTGTAAATPVAPLLQQDSTIWEMSLAQVRVPAGATGIVVEDIADEREYTSLLTDQLLTHLADRTNPHSVTAAQVGAAPASDNAGFHNSIYRGKFLGNQVTPEQYARIADGTFKDMYIGDYWIINGVQYIIAAFNYYYNTGPADAVLTQNHITLVPRSVMYFHAMNDTKTAEGGYLGSKMRTEGLDQARSKILSAFPGHVVTHKRFLSNAVSDGQASGAVWVDSDIELMNEAMVFGHRVNGTAVLGFYDTGIEKAQLPLFRFRHDLIGVRDVWWLRDVSGSSFFVTVTGPGYPSRDGASYAYGVRPVFSISA